MVSTAIVVERQEDDHAYPVQRPVYFVSEVLSESKARYQPVQKLLYAVLITSRKLRHYFQEYSISVVTDYPSGTSYGIKMLLEESLNGQSSSAPSTSTSSHEQSSSHKLVNFMAEWRENQLPTPTERPEHWVMYFDNSLTLEGAGAGVFLISPQGEQPKYVL
jgi:hypothetical protein